MLSVLIITKNEEDVIGDAIESLGVLADEVIVIDGGSTDATVEVSSKKHAKVVKSEFKNFADQRNLAASTAHEPWIMYLDSDERVTPAFIKELKEKIGEVDQDSNIAGFYIRRKTFFYGKDWKFQDKVQRVFKKDKLKEWKGVVHETPLVDGRLLTINEPILHYTHRNLEQMIQKTNSWSEYEAELRIKSNHPRMSVWRFPRVMLTGFTSSYFGQGGYKNGTAGMVEAIYQAFSMFITYAKLWEKQQGNKLTK